MDGIIDQARAIETLQAALRSGRLHHAYIFHGPAGVGKFTTALAFARILLCHDPQINLAGQVVACGACESCRLLDSPQAMHLDLHVITKELALYSDDPDIRKRKLMVIPIQVLRDTLIEPVYRAAHLRHNKVLIVDEADLLAPIGQNALLKTLEEPPAGTFIILVTSNEDRLLPTVRSRCQRVPFVPLPDEAVDQWLKKHRESLSAKDRAWLVQFADGSIGRADLGAEYGLASWANAVLPALDAMAAGRFVPELGATIAQQIDDFATRWVEAHKNASKDAANRMAAALMWSLIAGYARRRIRDLSAQCDPNDPEAGEALLEPYLGVIDALQTAEREVAGNVNLGLVADHLVLLMHQAFTHHALAAHL